MPEIHDPPLGESDTRAKLINPALYGCCWTEDHIRREEMAGAVELVNGKPRRRSKGRVGHTLRLKISHDSQPVAVALIEAKAEIYPPGQGLDQGKGYARCQAMNVPFVFSSNGHMFVEYDIAEATAKAKALTKESRELKAKAENIENAVYDLKAVNPNKKVVEDTRTPAELIKIIEDEGKKIAKALAKLKGVTK